MTGGFKDHFSGGSKGYAAFRPRYPDGLADLLAGLVVRPDAVWDCGCGTGQLSVSLGRTFGRVFATDASADQVAAGDPAPNVTYSVGRAEASGLPDGSVDLVVAAQAAHWFDLPAFYAEARRVARPGAAIALVTYGIFDVDPAVDPVLHGFYREMGPYWPPERAHVEVGYASLDFPFDPAKVAHDLAVTADVTFDGMIGYVGTWSAVKQAVKAGQTDPVGRLAAALAPAWGPPETVRTVRWPLTVKAGRLRD